MFNEELLTDYIQKHGLNTSSRIREQVYKRAVISKFLQTHGWTLSRIGRMFNRDHATIINALKVYDQCNSYDDFKLLEYFVYNDLIKFVELEKAEHIEKAPDFTQLTPIEFQLIGANTLKDFRRIKEQVVNKALYL